MTTALGICRACNRAIEHSSRFCRHCGVPCSTDLSFDDVRERGGEGEHKQVTVLCTDVQGSLALAEQVEPEDWHEIMFGLFAIIVEAARRYGGTVSRFTGDGLMALFGAPLAQEDHAQRAGYAAIDARDGLGAYADHLRRTRGLSFSVRIGLNSGDVVVSRFGDEPGFGYTAIGHTVGLAERMERLAEPGKIYATEATVALVSGLLEARDLGSFELRGLPGPLRIYEVVGRGVHRTRFDVAGARGFSPFVGRAEPMRALERALERSTRGEGQVVEIVGEPGVGKSRLCHELVAECRRRHIRVVVWHAHSHLSSAPALTFIEDFRRILGVSQEDTPSTVRDKVSRGLRALDEGLAQFLPILFDVMGIAEDGGGPGRDPMTRVAELARTTEKLAHVASTHGPVVVVMEDLHWIDETSARMLEAFLAAVPSLSLLAVVTSRPEYRPPRPVAAERIELGPLPVRQAAELVGTLLGPDPSIFGIAGRILERAGGNPFFIEEIVWSLAESGALAGERGRFLATRPDGYVLLPASLQASLGARIDRLGPFEKHVLQAAAVIGQEVSARPLQTIVGAPASRLAPALERLAREGFLLPVGSLGAARYRFSHPLLWEEAYGSQLGEVRARTHAAVARALSEIDSTRIEERASVIAHHWEQGGDRLQAARWMKRSAEWLAARKVPEAFASWRRVVELVRGLDDAEALRLAAESRVHVLDLGARVGLDEGEARALFEEGQGLAGELADGLLLARLSAAYGQIRLFRGDTRAAIDLVEGGLALAEGSEEIVRELQVTLAFAYFNDGRYRRVCELTEEALHGASSSTATEADSGHPRDWHLLLLHAMAAISLGRLEDARHELEMVLAVAEHGEDRELLCLACAFVPVLALIAGDDPEPALARAQQAVTLAIDLASPLVELHARWGLGLALLGSGDWEASERAIAEALADARRCGFRFASEAGMLAHLAEAAAGRGAFDVAVERAEEAVAMARRSGANLFEGVALVVLARIRLFAAGGAASEEIAAMLERVRALSALEGLRMLEPAVLLIEGMTALSRGDAVSGRASLQRAQREFAAIGAHGHATRLNALVPGEARA